MPPEENQHQGPSEQIAEIWQDAEETLKADALEPEDATRMEHAFAAVEEILPSIADPREKSETEERLKQYKVMFGQKTKL